MSASVCPSCELPAELADDGQGLGFLICADCKAVADILDEMPYSQWPRNDIDPVEALKQTLPEWMRQCHHELLGRFRTTTPISDADVADLASLDEYPGESFSAAVLRPPTPEGDASS